MAGDCDLSPWKRQKPTSKGKEKMEEDSPEHSAGEEEEVTCGICLAEERRSIRGEMDSCGHYFCFVCIMAWSRIESRCPLCKLRFRSIRRPPVPGVFPSERVVPVAERNQVYHPLGNESTSVSDPYTNTDCSVCNCSKDEELLLLCELCDSAAHTYCVGLGATVPDGDWYCPDCATSKEEHSKSQRDDESTGDQDNSKTTLQVQRPKPVISIFDIVAEDTTSNSSRRTNAQNIMPERRDEHLPSQSTSTAGCQHRESPREQDNGHAALYSLACNGVEIGARTLQNSRHLNNRVRALRENWAALRAGSLGFSSYSLNTSKKSGVGTASRVTERQRCAMPASEQTTTSSNPSKTVNREDTRDVCKAWKMMEMAKSVGGMKKCNKPCLLNSCDNRKVSGEAKSFPPPPFSMGNRATAHSLFDKIGGPENQSLSHEVADKNIGHHDRGRRMKHTPSPKNLQDCHRVPMNLRVSSAHEKSVSSRDRIVYQESFNDRIGSSSQSKCVDQTGKRPVKSKSDVMLPQEYSSSSGQSMLSSLQELRPSGQSHATDVNPEGLSVSCVARCNGIDNAAISGKVKNSLPGQNGHGRKRKLDDKGSPRRSSSTNKTAKSEILPLVKHELKLLKIDKTYGANRFKEVARAATHTILAACGLEHSESVALEHSRPACNHSEKIKELKCCVTPDSCRECFCQFVKEVVGSVLSNTGAG